MYICIYIYVYVYYTYMYIYLYTYTYIYVYRCWGAPQEHSPDELLGALTRCTSLQLALIRFKMLELAKSDSKSL